MQSFLSRWLPSLGHRLTLFFVTTIVLVCLVPILTPALAPPTPQGKGIQVENSNVIRAIIPLSDPQSKLRLDMANINSSTQRQQFQTFVQQNPQAAIVASGTYAAGTNWPLKSRGHFVGGTDRFARYSTGTVLGITANNVPQMVTIKTEGLPNWDQYDFALTAGPRLLKNGQGLPWMPTAEGFRDPKVTNVDNPLARAAIGFSQDGKTLYYVIFKQNISLRQEAALMEQLGCWEAMNLDGGGTIAFAQNDRVIWNSTRPQTHVVLFYDAVRPAPN